MERIGTVGAVCRYPVKSMAGEELGAAFVGFAGMMGDRAFAFVRKPGPKGFPWLTGREQESLVTYRPRYRAGTAAATALPVDLEASFGMAPGVNPVFPSGNDSFAVEVATPGGRTLALDSGELKAELQG
jgi:MOSC domain-containing protein